MTVYETISRDAPRLSRGLNALNKNVRFFARVASTFVRYRLFRQYRNVHWSTVFIGNSRISHTLSAGAFCSVGPRAWIGANVHFGNYVMLAPDVTITGGGHVFDIPGTPIIFSGKPNPKHSYIEDDVWIGQRVTIRAGVLIGRGAVIGMGSIVIRDVPAYAIAAGNPARVIGWRFRDESQRTHDSMLSLSPKIRAPRNGP